MNKGRRRPTRAWPWAIKCGCPPCVADRERGAEGPGARVPDGSRGRPPDGRRTSRPAWPCTAERRQLGRHRAVAPGPAVRRGSSNCASADKKTSGLLLIAKQRLALVALQEQFRSRETGKTYAALVDRRLAGGPQGDRRAAAQVPDRPGERRVRDRWGDDEGAPRPLPRCKVGELHGLRVARRDHRSLAAPTRFACTWSSRPPDRRRRGIRRLRRHKALGQGAARSGATGSSACSCTPAASASITPRPARRSNWRHPCPLNARNVWKCFSPK